VHYLICIRRMFSSNISGRGSERRSLELRLDRNSYLISTLSGLHHCHS